MKFISVMIVVGFFLSACTSTGPSGDRNPSSISKVHEIPEGLKGGDLADFEHLSEGADIFPYEWMKALNSVTFKDEKGKASKAFLSDLDQRFGFLSSPLPQNAQGKTFLMPYVGLSATWSNHPPRSADAFVEDGGQNIRTINGIKSIRMVGTNCAVCHSGALDYRGTTYKINGSPSMANVRGFFIDMAKSTIGMLAKENLMADFMKRLQVPQPEARAKEITKYFIKRLGEETNTFFDAGQLSGFVTLGIAQLPVFGNKSRFFKGKKAIGDALTKLLRVTYGFGEGDDIGELAQRMQFLGTLMVGTDPKLDETISGFNRTDAFGRIGNLVLRGNDPISYTAPVSLPYIWGIKYMAMLHYNGNSNSVIMRNVGQSLGLGAIVLNKDLDSTVHVENLIRLENLVHKLQVPWWEKIFPQTMPEFQINKEYSRVGQKVYIQHCATCHESNRFVGPTFQLREYKMIALDKLGTDPNAAQNAVKAVGTVKFEDSIFNGVGGVKNKYYQKNGISQARQDEMEFRGLRGNEFFRDTLNGFTEAEQNKFGNNYGMVPAGTGYKARHLAGVWGTAPFLHNGSVPSMWDLLQPVEKRPKYFNVRSREFNPVKLGFLYERKPDWKGSTACKKAEETCYDTTRSGNHNTGHEYGTHLTEGEKMALIEYLKELPPESEYSWY